MLLLQGKAHIKKFAGNLRNSNNAKEMQNANTKEGNNPFSTGNVVTSWVLDSGTTCHISSQWSHFHTLVTSVREFVTMANGQSVKSSGKGSCNIQTLISDGESPFYTIFPRKLIFGKLNFEK